MVCLAVQWSDRGSIIPGNMIVILYPKWPEAGCMLQIKNADKWTYGG